MGVKEFWKNRSYLQKGFIIGILLYFGYLAFVFVILSATFPKALLFDTFIFGPLICGILFGFIGFLIGFIKKEERTRIINEIKMKDEGYFLKPNKGKILITFLVVVSTYVVIVLLCILFKRSVCYFLSYNDFFRPMMLLVDNLTKLSLFILLLLAYALSCFRIKNKKGWLIGIVLYLIAFISISQGIVYAIDNYNAKYGYSCNINSDCYCDCHGGPVTNHRYIRLSIGSHFYSRACKLCYAICKNNQCELLRPEKASLEDCGRLQYASFEEAICYKDFSQKLNDSSLCYKIKDEGFKEGCLAEFATSIEDCEKMMIVKKNCYHSLAYKLKDPGLCNKGPEGLIEGCISQVQELIENE